MDTNLQLEKALRLIYDAMDIALELEKKTVIGSGVWFALSEASGNLKLHSSNVTDSETE